MVRRFRRLSRRCAVLAGVHALLLVHPPALADYSPPGREARAAGLRVTVSVAPGNWGDADPADVQRVLTSVAQVFSAQFGELPAGRHAGGLRLRVVPRGTAPRVLFERGEAGEYLVHLSARDQRWYQYAYQFGHELCHVFSNFDHKAGGGEDHAAGNQWFEESLCETAALFTLRQLAIAWETAPPARKWLGYGPAFAAYADQLLAEPQRRLPTGQTLAQWFAENRSLLAADPYLRDKNALFATALLPLFEREPARWQTIAYLNADAGSAGKAFEAYLADWLTACPPQDRPLVRDTMEMLGIAPVEQTAAAAPPR